MQKELNTLGQPVGRAVANWKGCPQPAREILHGHYCRLEPLDPACHVTDLFCVNAADDGRMWTYLPYGPFASQEEYLAWLNATCLGSDPLFYAIVDVASGRALGLTSYLRIIPEHGSLEIGHVAYSPALRRTRMATEATALLLRNAFALGYRRVEWKCNALNEASRAAARRLGFSFEGLFRQHVIIKGRSRDTAWYAIIDGDWPSIDAAQRRWLDPRNFDAQGEQVLVLSDLTAPLLRPVAGE
ncbi:MAG TPA: GNAT family protein [Gammaproteobacteria bacterium]